MANAYNYSNTAQQTALNGSISAGALSVVVGATTGFPASTPYILALDYGAATEELVSVTSVAGTTLTVTRGFGGTSAQSHGIGAVVRHVVNAQDLVDFRTHEASTGAVHGLTGSIVGTSDSQTLTNKTLTSPTINTATVSGGTFNGNPSFAGNPSFSGTPTFAGSPLFTGGPLFNTTPPVFQQSAAATIALAASVSGDSNSRLRVQADGGLNWGPGSSPTDTNLYRAGTNLLKTDDAFQTVGELQPQNLIRQTRANATDNALETRVTGDANARLTARTDGQLGWGPGTTGFDVTMFRQSAGTLFVNGSLQMSGVGQVLRARKTATTSVSSNVTPSPDPHLTVPVTANSIYEMDGVLFVSSASLTPDILIGFDGPSGCSGTWSGVGYGTATTSEPDAVRTIAAAIGGGNVRSYGIATTGTVYGIQVNGMFEMAANAGNVNVIWAQATSNATATNMLLYSWFRLTRVA